MTQDQLNKGTELILKLAEEDPATWIDRGLLGGLGYGAKNVINGEPLKGIAQMLGSPIGAIKGGLNGLTLAGEDFNRAISQAATGEITNAATNSVKGLYNATLGSLQGSLLGNGWMSPKQKENYNKPDLERL